MAHGEPIKKRWYAAAGFLCGLPLVACFVYEGYLASRGLRVMDLWAGVDARRMASFGREPTPEKLLLARIGHDGTEYGLYIAAAGVLATLVLLGFAIHRRDARAKWLVPIFLALGVWGGLSCANIGFRVTGI
jgi:hypothetical protein